MSPKKLRPGRATTPDDIALAEPDPDAEEPETGPTRRCAVTRERQATGRMIRFVIGPDNSVVPDLAARLPGRGIWLSAQRDVIESASRRGAFAKAARANVSVRPDLVLVLQAALARRVVDHLGLARRAGQAVSGFAKAREWLAAGHAALVVHAAGGSAEELDRLLGGRRDTIPVVEPLDAAALGAVFGRDSAVHVAVAPGKLAERLRMEAERLAGLMAAPAETDGETAGTRKRRRKHDTPHGLAARDDEQGAGG